LGGKRTGGVGGEEVDLKTALQVMDEGNNRNKRKEVADGKEKKTVM